jgi:rod shape-determining protein MreD
LLLLMNDLIVLAIRLAAGADFPGIQYFLGSIVAAALWLPLGALLKLPLRPRNDPDQF